MSVIAELEVDPADFELGRILELRSNASVELETLVPLGESTVPFVRVHDEVRDSFEKSVRDHPSVENLREVDRHAGETLYALRWNDDRDHFFNALKDVEAQMMSALGTAQRWEVELRFSSHEALARFHKACDDAHIDLTVVRIYNPTKPGTGPWFGLTPEQRETLVRAVEGGYYSIPRRLSTIDLAEEFDISDQAVTERLRRAIITLVEHTVMSAEESEPSIEK
ncbi:helix-turn-helix domain-containing protein [Salinigranum sp. GCM10025319]|uniref:helix-turn-helix domain-containing protein n=1 Tax=Salinigranum sp. GCM10025319 TaxID=3252687 RepID=UPI00360B9D1B